ncbi:MAG: hypothetical protein DIZ80_09265 [endosymbiont of Galathealinum brachiosum]|uniref:Virulence-associated protein E-like domain-containing protein n=1 Tax=endosymbiont of Galathealinum brachiosum TaxID=2200906 RepID=A0A370DD10_9GAMM|nr:MAG: hypothetical protein DIZ80_09265 [endosymbiont of Galathealinum brachiosum]
MSYDINQKTKEKTDPRLITINKVAQEISLTRFTGTPGSRLTKNFVKDSQGKIQKESQPQFSNGEAETLKIKKLSDLEEVTQNLQPNQCIATGTFNLATCNITTKSNFSDNKYELSFRTRSKEDMHRPEFGIGLFDYDQDDYMPENMKCNSPDELMKKLVTAIPEFEGMGYSAVGSSSNGIIDEITAAPFQSNGGMHIYIALKSIDLDQLKQFIKVRLWNSGLGYISYARNGAMLERTLLDLSVLSPERMIYEAKPVLGEGISQKPRIWNHKEGKAFTANITLSNEEISQYEQLVTDAKKNNETIAISDKLQNNYRNNQVTQRAKDKSISLDEAEKLIPKRSLAELSKSTQILGLDETIEINGQMMLVSELLARGEEFDGKAMPDPIEGSSYGYTTAKYYHNGGKNPLIVTLAHGVKTVYKIQQENGSFKRVKTNVVTTKSINLNEPLDIDSFPHKRMKKDGTYKPICTIENIERLIIGYGISVNYDVISKDTMILIPGVSGITENSANTAIESINSLASLNNIPIGQVPRYVAVIADRNAINPVAEWITCKKWDQVDRINSLCDTLITGDDFPNDFKNILVTKWLISAVAAATVPSGFHCKGVLTFQGAQNLGKTSWLNKLIPKGLLRDNFFLDGHHIDPSNKDSLTTAIKHWIVEIGELDSSFKKDIARLKGFITQGKDTVRRPYARTNSDYQRRTVFCASVNEVNFLIDKTGNSRFWTIPLVKIDYKHNIDMQQVFAQLYDELQQGATWWLTEIEEKQLDEQNQTHKSVSVIEERVLTILNHNLPKDKWKNMSASKVLQAAGIQSPSNPQARECGSILRGLYGQPKKIQGIMKWLVPIDLNFTHI